VADDGLRRVVAVDLDEIDGEAEAPPPPPPHRGCEEVLGVVEDGRRESLAPEDDGVALTAPLLLASAPSTSPVLLRDDKPDVADDDLRSVAVWRLDLASGGPPSVVALSVL
jgi:hypothetical protein